MPAIRNLTPQTRRIRGGAPVAAGTSDTQTFTEIDTQGFESCVITVVLGTITGSGTATLRAKGSNTSSTYGSGTVDLFQVPGTSTVASAAASGSGDSNKVLTLEIYRPGRRYIRPEVVRATANVVIDSIVVELFNPIPNSLQTQAAADGYATVVQGASFSAS